MQYQVKIRARSRIGDGVDSQIYDVDAENKTLAVQKGETIFRTKWGEKWDLLNIRVVPAKKA